MSQKMNMELLAAIGVALTGDTMDIVPIPEAKCDECEYMELPHEGGHCYMFQDAPEDNRCGAFEDKQYKMEWK